MNSDISPWGRPTRSGPPCQIFLDPRLVALCYRLGNLGLIPGIVSLLLLFVAFSFYSLLFLFLDLLKMRLRYLILHKSCIPWILAVTDLYTQDDV